MNKVRHGTPQHDADALCDSCSYATIVRGPATNDEIVRCNILDREVRFKVLECSSHNEKRGASLGAMQETAWRWCTDQAGESAFLSPLQRRIRQQKGEVLD